MTDTTSPIMFSHIPVLLQECIDALAIKPNGIYVDCTLGGGGHSEQIAKRLASGRLIAIDRDENAVAASRKRLSPYADRITFVHNNFSALPQILEDLQIPAVDGLLADLGVSSYQLDTPARGFSYQHDAPLDMRMDSRAPFLLMMSSTAIPRSGCAVFCLNTVRSVLPRVLPPKSYAVAPQNRFAPHMSLPMRCAPAIPQSCARTGIPQRELFRQSALRLTTSFRSSHRP